MPDVKALQELHAVTIRFSGDSGDGMQLTGAQFTDTSALMGNDISTLPDFPAEIRAPIGTLPGVSSFQIQFADATVFTPGDVADVLVAMNPAALKVDLTNVKKNGLIIVNEDAFTEDNLKKASWTSNPLEDQTLKDYQVIRVPVSVLTRNALKDSGLKPMEIDRCKNFFALGLAFWLFERSLDHTMKWINEKFAKRPEIAQANITALKAGRNYGDITETVKVQYRVKQAPIKPGTYRKITGNEATAIGLITAATLAKKTLFYSTYPITPASDILHHLAEEKAYGVKTFQAEDEIAAAGAAVGASFGGQLGITGTSGPGMCLKAEMLGLAVMAELPVVVINVQRAGPSTGMPTKPEQGDLLQALFSRHSESPVAVLAARSPADCFTMAMEAVRIAVKYMTPVILLTDGYLANSAEPWLLPDIEKFPKIDITHAKAVKGEKFLPYQRDPETLARPWAIPGTPGLEHRIGGLSKADLTGAVNYDPENNQKMHLLRAEKIRRIAREVPDLEVRGAQSGKLLLLGWGSTYGSIHQAVSDLEREGIKVSQAHLRHMNPFPKNLGKVLEKFDKVLVPEMNFGQLLMLLRNQFPSVAVRTEGFNRVTGQPFKVAEIVQKVKEVLK